MVTRYTGSTATDRHQPLLIKLLTETAQMPLRATPASAGVDLFADEDVLLGPQERKLIKTGIAVRIPAEHVGLIWPRSGLALRSGLAVMAGVIDADYRGELGVLLHNTDLVNTVPISRGDRIAQLLLQAIAVARIVEKDDLDDTERGRGGFGSTGGF